MAQLHSIEGTDKTLLKKKKNELQKAQLLLAEHASGSFPQRKSDSDEDKKAYLTGTFVFDHFSPPFSLHYFPS